MDVNILKAEINRLAQLLIEREEEIKDLKENIHMHIFEGMLRVSDEFSLLLNPPSIDVKGTFNNKSAQYSIKVEDVVCVTSEGNYKLIWLKDRIPGRGESERNTDVITVRSGWSVLMEQLDRIGFHFLEVNKETYVNVKYFKLQKNILSIDGFFELPPDIAGVKYELKKGRVGKFMNMKDNYNRVSLQKNMFRNISEKMKNSEHSFGN